jgi:phosphatidylglycerol:prolipoprotein diacylglycerol transferase
MPQFGRAAFVLFGMPVYWYGLLIVSGILLGFLLMALRETRFGLPKETGSNLALWIIPAAIIGARAYYVAFSWDEFQGDFWSIVNLRGGGMAIYGGLIGGAIGGLFFAKFYRLRFLTLCDIAAPSIALGQAVGRWGNFINQEAYGVAITQPALQFFPMAVWIEAQNGWFAATFFYESAWCFLIVIFLLVGEWRHFFRRPGEEFLWYAALYAFERMLVEGLRTDSLYWGPIRVSQALSFALLVACALLLVRIRRSAAK